MNKDEIKKSLAVCVGASCEGCAYHDDLTCIDTLKTDARKCIIKQENEIAQLKADNARLTAKLGQVLLSIDTVKEMNTMCSIDEKIKQAKIEVLTELKKKKSIAIWDIDEMIAEVQNGGDKS